MKGIIASAVDNRGIVAALAAIFIAAGSWLALTSKLDVLPDFAPPQVVVQTEAPGLAPEQVETLVTRPLENTLGGLANMERISSESISGLSVITLIFADSADIHLSRQEVAERLAEAASSLPPGVDAPRMTPLTSATMDLLKIGLVSDKLSPRELRTLADWEIRPRLLAVPGVARITVYGGEQLQYHVQVDPARLAATNLTLTDLIDAAQGALGARGTGQIDLAAQRIPITASVTANAVAALKNAVITTRDGSVVLLGSVAQVNEDAAIPFGDAVIQGRRGVLLSLSSQYGANTLSVTRDLERELRDLVPSLQARGIVVYPALHRPASFVETALGNLRNALILGAVFIAIVLVLFLRDWHSAFISFLAIPLSLFTAVAVFHAFGMALNTLTLGGFAVALGVLVDDAVIYLENILRRLRENKTRQAPRSRLAVIRDASREITGAVAYATGVILLVFGPVFMLGGVQGSFMRPLALAFSLSVLASLLVAVTVTPALAALLLRDEPARLEPRWLAALRGWHLRALQGCERRPRLTLVIAGIALLAALGALPLLAGEFMPTFREGHFVGQVSARVPGTSLDAMTSLGSRISADLLKLPFIATVEQQVGRAEQGEDTWGPERSEFHIELKPDSGIDQDAAQEQVREVFGRYPAVQSDVLTFLGDRISESFSGETAQGVIQVFGPDLDTIVQVAARVQQVAAGVRGIQDVRVGHSGNAAMLSVNLLPARLRQYGLRAGDVLDALQTAFAGKVVAQAYERDRHVDVVVMLPPAERTHLDSVRALPLRSADGAYVRLEDVAQIYLATGRAAIRHEGGQRFAVVTYNAGDRGIAPVSADVRDAVTRDVKLPAGLWIVHGGEAEAQQASQRSLMLYSAAALALSVIVLCAAFHRRVLAGFVMLNLPFALIGGVFALAVTAQSLTLGAMVGLVTVFGISARNAILLLAHVEHLAEREHGDSVTPELVRRAAQERLLPVVMTAIVTALGLVPLALGLGKAGNEIEAPLAIVVLGGLTTSTVLSLVVLPMLVMRAIESRMAKWFVPSARIEAADLHVPRE